MRNSGVLLPVFSIPGKYGIGDLSKEAYYFVDWLKKAGQHYWQVLPTGPTSYGDSPYQPLSSFAGNPYFISPEMLYEDGLLTEEELSSLERPEHYWYIDYGDIYESRYAALRKAFSRFVPDADYARFCASNAYWLDDYCLYRTIKSVSDEKIWLEWDEPLKKRDNAALDKFRRIHAEEIRFFSFLEYEFDTQWSRLKKYANDNGIEIIGDIPIYVSMDSSDAWASTGLFSFDKDLNPVHVAGCPPDAFTPDGQLWGNPVYKWAAHKKENYTWWKSRIRKCFERYDVLRIDHFRGFESFFVIPASDKTAVNGWWEKGPGMDFFNSVADELGEDRVIAEDLGYLTPEVHQLLKDTGYPGMKVIQFAFDDSRRSYYLPQYYDKNCIAYTGTHDNQTLVAFLEDMRGWDRSFARDYLCHLSDNNQDAAWEIISLVMRSTAKTVIVPLHDYVCLGREARINTPGSEMGNWKWKAERWMISDDVAERIRRVTDLYDRLG